MKRLRTLAAAATLALAVTPSAYAQQTWEVNELAVDTIIPAPSPTVSAYYVFQDPDITAPLTVNNMVLTYQANITQSAFVGNTATFSETGTFQVLSYFNGYIPGVTDGVQVTSALGADIYTLWGTFSLTGTATIVGPNQLEVEVTTGTVTAYIDTDGEGNGLQQHATVGSASNVAEGGAILNRVGDSDAANGSFEVIWDDFLRTAFGEQYWPNPEPFHLILDVNSDIDALDGAFSLAGTNVDTSGQGNAFFRSVPEPGSLALLGIALFGFGAVARRRRSV